MPEEAITTGITSGTATTSSEAVARWARLESLFFATAALPGHERGPFLDTECGSDIELRRDVESLLAADNVAARDLSAVIEGAAGSLFAAEQDEQMEGFSIGHWRIVREIGRGGMGSVYLAARDGADFEKHVAVKLARRGIDTGAVLARFLEERRILASLNHPYIAQLVDAGTSPDGRPYFIMEYVEGLPIADYCAREHLTIAQRCDLFRKVCEPVSYAHGRLVIHRDLKPANILITPGGTPKLLDFGIAKLLSSGRPDDTAAHPLTHAHTPQYASPEQLRGDAVDTATDVYSLGVILRELVSGDPVPEDLAAIIATATREEKDRRYASVEQLSTDVRRYLAGLPVTARENTWGYRARRFAGRNRVSVTIGTLAAAMLIAGVISIEWEAHKAETERRRAEQRVGQMVELANRALLEVHGSLARLAGAADARRRVVKSTLDYLDKLRADSGGDPRVLASLASAYEEVAKIEGSPLQPNLGDLRGAEENYDKAEKILSGLVTADPSNPTLRLSSAQLNNDLALLYEETGRHDAALKLLGKALADIRVTLAAQPANFLARKTESYLLLQRGDITLYDDPAGTRRDDLARLPVNEALYREHPDDIDTLLNLASTWSQIGATYSREDASERRIECFRKAAALRERAYAMRPEDVVVERDLLIVYGHLGDALGSPFVVSAGDYKGAIAWYAKAVTIARAMETSDPGNRQARLDLGAALMRMGASRTAAADYRNALRNFEESAAILDLFTTGPPVNVSFAHEDALLHEYRARSLQGLGRMGDAMASWRRSLAVCAAVFAVSKDDVTCLKQQIVDWNGLAPLVAAEDRDAALSLGRQSLDLSRRLSHMQKVWRFYESRALEANGAIYRVLARRDPGEGERKSDWREAAGYYRESVALWRALEMKQHPYMDELLDAERGLAECERALAKS